MRLRGLRRAPEVLCAASWLLVALGCAQDAGQRDRGPRTLEPAGASLGAAAQRANGSAWKAVQGADFNLDGMSDVLWGDEEQNLMAVWLMEGTRLLAPGPAIPGPLGEGWVAAAAADFNHDGMADVLWNNPEQNLAAVWLMEGTRLLAPGPFIPGPIGDGWVVPSAADFNHDGVADVLWNNPEQNLMAVWLMEGTRLLAPGPFIPGPIGDGWVVVPNLTDHGRDGMADVVWNNPEQNLMAIWLMEGNRLLAPGPLIPGPAGDGWKALAVGDANFDGMGDVVWDHPERNLTAVWLMEGSQLLAPGPLIPGPAGDGWIVVAANDFNGDGEADVLWTNAEQELSAIWLMEGSRLIAAGPAIPGPP
ncbi:FG-GAP repeat domain-containing protein [Sorangium sp. So ce394]|uniref:FG-GAP repeat domain-containing protein n=1 Tax=Sorangium sp. So ce394 TaxID=3133310 RepID=UPI003F5BED7E